MPDPSFLFSSFFFLVLVSVLCFAKFHMIWYMLYNYVFDPTPVTFYSQQRLFAVQVFELHRLIKVRL